jgi:hypothetical protein
MRELKIAIYEAPLFPLHENSEVEANFTKFFFEAELLKLGCLIDHL